MPMASVSSDTRPRKYSVLAVVRVTTWWVMCTTDDVCGVEAVAQLGVAEREAALDGTCTSSKTTTQSDLLEAGGEGVVVAGAVVVEGLAGDVAQAGGVVGDGEGVGVRLVLGGAAQHGRGEDEHLVGERGDGGEHARAAG